MKPLSCALGVLLLALGLLAPIPAGAIPTTISFTFSGPGTGNQPVTGSFSFDSTILPSTGFLAPVTDPWAISFTFDGHTFTTADAALNLLVDGSGNLSAWSLYSTPNNNTVAPGFTLDGYWAPSLPGVNGVHAVEATFWTAVGQSPMDTGTGTWAMEVTPVPEPALLSMFGLGLPFVVLLARRRNR